MSLTAVLIIAAVILFGVIGAVVQVWPSSPFVGGAILVWAWMTGTRSAWIIFAISAAILILGTILKYIIPARGMTKAGIPQSTLLILGMIAAIFIVEYLRNQDTQKAWKATVVALKAFGWTIAIELIAALSAATLWVVGLLLQSPAAA